MPINGAVRLRYRLFHEFLEENAANISSGGLFIHTSQPGEVGSELEFEVQLDDDFTLIQGRGEVVWVRRGGGQPGAEPGMGIRFVELPEDSRALVDRIVSERVAAGLALFDLAGDAPAVEAVAAERPAVVSPPTADDSPIWELDAGGAVTADTQTEEEPLAEEPVVEVSPGENLAALDPDVPGSGASRRPLPAPDSSSTRPGQPGAVGSRSSPLRLIAVAVLSAPIGASAVLAFYWLYVQPTIDALETRIDELAGSPGGPWQPPADEPDSVAATAGDAATGADSAEVGFVQSYRSERYKDLVRKRLLMVREDGGWKIAAERAAP